MLSGQGKELIDTQEPLYKIYDEDTGLFSSGGNSGWSRAGKVWTARTLKLHLANGRSNYPDSARIIELTLNAAAVLPVTREALDRHTLYARFD